MSNDLNNKFVDFNNAREEKQKEAMKLSVANGECPFCMENLKKYHQKPIIKETNFWVVTLNAWPYKHTKYHFLLIYKIHIEKLSDLDPLAGAELFEIAQSLESEYDLPGGGLAMRFGDTKHSAGTVLHLHAHLIMPDVDHPDYLSKPVRFKIGSTAK